MVDKLIKVAQNRKYTHNNNKDMMLNNPIVIMNNPMNNVMVVVP